MKLVLFLVMLGIFGCQQNPDDLFFAPLNLDVRLDGTAYASGSQYAFGNVAIGSGGKNLTGLITNNGPASVRFNKNPSITVTGTNASSFTIVGPFETTIKSGESTGFQLSATAKLGGGHALLVRVMCGSLWACVSITQGIYGGGGMLPS
jgi:hypothetical protein